MLYAYLWGLAYPIYLDLLNRRIGSEVRATVLSVAQMTGSFSYVILAPLFGRLADVLSLSQAFLIVGAYFIAYAAIVLTSFFKRYPQALDPIVSATPTVEV